MNPLVLAALGVGALVLLTGGGGGSKTAQPPLPRDPGSGKRPKPDGGGGVVGDGGGVVGGGGGVVGDGGGVVGGSAGILEIQRLINSILRLLMTTPRLIEEDGLLGPETLGALNFVVDMAGDYLPSDVPGVSLSPNRMEIVGITDASAVSGWLNRLLVSA